MEPLTLFFSQGVFSAIMYIALAGLGLTVIFLIAALVVEIRRKTVW